MPKYLNLLFPVIVMFFSAAVIARTADFSSANQSPHFRFTNKTMLLNTGKAQARIFVFYNDSPQPIWLDRFTECHGASAGWNSQLTPNHWSALLLEANQHNALWTCADQKFALLPCKTAVKICTLTVPDKPAAGNFWIAENQPSAAALWQKIKSRGMNISECKI